MNRILQLTICFFLLSGSMNAQLRNDTFFVRDTAMNYTFTVTKNDVLPSQYELITVDQISGSVSNYVILDSNRIVITDTNKISATLEYRYKLRNKLTGDIDSATVVVNKQSLTSNVYPGDCNNDGKVDHLDILPIGMKQGAIGSPRHFLEINSNFRPYYAGNWKTSTANTNDKYLDVDGNGYIDQNDFEALKRFSQSSWKTQTPIHSGSSLVNILSAKLVDTSSIGDTFQFIAGNISVPVKIFSPTLLDQSYGMAYKFELSYQDKTTGRDTFYPAVINFKNFNLWGGQPYVFLEKNVNSYSVAATKLDGTNGSSDGYAGVVEIVVDVILVGIVNRGDVGRFKLDFKDVLWVKNDASVISISPRPYTFYVKNVSNSAGLGQTIEQQIRIMPNIVENQFRIEKSIPKVEPYTIYNTQGIAFDTGILREMDTQIIVSNWPAGIYYLRLESTGQSFKLQKY